MADGGAVRHRAIVLGDWHFRPQRVSRSRNEQKGAPVRHRAGGGPSVDARPDKRIGADGLASAVRQ